MNIKLMCFILLKLLSDEIKKFNNLKINKVKLNVSPCLTKKCTIYSCRKINVQGEIVNLRNFQESKTNCKNGREIWMKIYNSTLLRGDNSTIQRGDNSTIQRGDNSTIQRGDNSTIQRTDNSKVTIKELISGIHFTISVHIAYNYHDLYFFYYHNVKYYLKHRKYFKNFMLLFIFIRNNLKFQICPKNKQTVKVINQILKEIGCLDCQKCQILGSLQFIGLQSCLELGNDNYVYAILFYKKLLRTLEMVYFLEKLI